MQMGHQRGGRRGGSYLLQTKRVLKKRLCFLVSCYFVIKKKKKKKEKRKRKRVGPVGCSLLFGRGGNNTDKCTRQGSSRLFTFWFVCLFFFFSVLVRVVA